MKRILLSLLAVTTLIGCGKNDDNTSGDGGGNNGNNSTSIEKLVKKITKKELQDLNYHNVRDCAEYRTYIHQYLLRCHL